MQNRSLFPLALIFLALVLILASRELLPANYLASSLYKLIFLTPLFYRVLAEKKGFKEALGEGFSLNRFRKGLGATLLVGLVVMAIYLLGFFLFRGYLDLSTIVSQLRATADINAGNLLLIGLYIITLNSLLEEFFWRGFIFDRLSSSLRPWLAHLLTGLTFSLHHVMFYYNWFPWPLLLLATVGLTVFAVIMNLLFAHNRDLFSCWLAHAFADVAQISIAFMVFGIL